MAQKKMTPLMEQYWSIKNQHQDKILLFRMGDFFEIFHEDAAIAAPILNIALVSRNKKAADETKMCGVPHHAIAGPIGKLLGVGYKVAICDQVEDPKLAKGLVKRAVTRILSPGMVYDPSNLDELSANFIAGFDSQALSFLDPSTGECFFYRTKDFEHQLYLLRLLAPVEIVLNSAQKQDWFGKDFPLETHLSSHDGQLEEDLQLSSDLPESAKNLVSYVTSLRGGDKPANLRPFEERVHGNHLDMSAKTLWQLEIFQNYSGGKKGSLYQAIHRTKTPGGSRLLKQRLRFPFIDPNEISKRSERVEAWTKKSEALRVLREEFTGLGDVERKLSKLNLPTCHARDLLELSKSLEVGLHLNQHLATDRFEDSLQDELLAITEKVSAQLLEEPGIHPKAGKMFRSGLSSELDHWMDLTDRAQEKLKALEEKEKKALDIPSLKAKWNNVYGYSFEVTKTHSAKVPSRFRRKQTLVNAERYTTDELDELQSQILVAQDKRNELELKMFESLVKEILSISQTILFFSTLWSELDLETSFAHLALEWNYSKPVASKEGQLCLLDSRHPVVEQQLQGSFVPNSIELQPSGTLLLTGPNMAGKSTLMRQVALTALMHQVGSFVPSSSASLPIYQKIFSRVGASDSLSEGQSTFMVEMRDAAEIVHQANRASLVIIDEVGRGTSTYDGLSLAQGILEWLTQKNRPHLFFATHYHELTRIVHSLPGVSCAHMAISEAQGEIRFLHSLRPGPAHKSYGIHVGRLAGLPESLTKRSQQILNQLESSLGEETKHGTTQMSLQAQLEADFEEKTFEDLSVSEPPAVDPNSLEIIEALKGLEVSNMTPLKALTMIEQWQQELS